VPFRGNPAAVCLLTEAIDDLTMQSIATEFGLSETAFVLGDRIRFFSPKMEIPLCGHATLAAAKVLFQSLDESELSLTTGGGVTIPITRQASGELAIGFPREELQVGAISQETLDSLGITECASVWKAEKTPVILVEINDAIHLQNLAPDFDRLERSCAGINGIVVTAPGDEEFDYYMRYFWPWSRTNEDPVTGGVQRFVAPFWAEKLGKTNLRAHQSSPRGGELELAVSESQVTISGEAAIVLEGILIL
jgi:PhzF family phenazine biosynthesis protein